MSLGIIKLEGIEKIFYLTGGEMGHLGAQKCAFQELWGDSGKVLGTVKKDVFGHLH